MKKKYGFTLAEVLVTMGIIGVLAMIMIPVLNDAQPNKEMIMLKKAYHTTSRIVSELINDEDLYPDDPDDDSKQGFANTDKVKYHGREFEGPAKFCNLFVSKINATNGDDPIKICKGGRTSLKDGGNFTTTDGIAWKMGYETWADGDEFIVVDVNGTDKKSGKPNCTKDNYGITTDDMPKCADGVGPDRFAFRIGKFGQLTPYSDVGKAYVSSTKTTWRYVDFVSHGEL